MTQPRSNTRTVLSLMAVGAGMAGLAWASVPLYDLFCRVTGYGGTTQQVTQAAPEVLDRTVTVRFDASVGADMPWSFRPTQTTMKIRIGETGLAFYEAHNPTDRPVSGTASFNVTPLSMGGYFAKIDCFCFVEQTLQPGETVQMPVTFFIDPEMVDDAQTARVHTITLGYTFFEIEPEPSADARPAKTVEGG
ncbi:MAG: cytochrome c oxidase assembly protein [Pseudomonadota bacterium]